MVENIPGKKDFGEVANHLLHRAWSSTIEIISHSPDYYTKSKSVPKNGTSDGEGNFNFSIPKENASLYWSGVRASLAANIASITQSVEFFLKGRICDVSPYLLLLNDGRAWTGDDVDFTSLKTVDAQHLLKIHDSVCEEKKKLGGDFKVWFYELRKERNKIMHTVDTSASYEPYNILCWILECHEFFYGPRKWCKARQLFLQTDAMSDFVFMEDQDEKKANITQKIFDELDLLFGFIEPSKSIRFFNYRKKDRASPCPACIAPAMNHFYSDHECYLPTLQQVEGGDYLSCFVCEYEAVFNGQCKNEDCNGETLTRSSKICLWCNLLR